jgi:AcrR family transcriptional regulator
MVYTKKIDREMLVAVAYDLLEHEGIEAISMRRLAQLLAVRASSLYHHFADKSALLRAVAEKGLRHLAEVLEQACIQAGPDPQQQIRALGMAYREWALLHSRLYLLLFGSTPMEEHPSPIAQAVSAPMLAAAAQLVGEQRSIAATQAAWAFVHGFVMLELAGQMRRGVPIEGFLLGLEVFVRGLSGSRLYEP